MYAHEEENYAKYNAEYRRKKRSLIEYRRQYH